MVQGVLRNQECGFSDLDLIVVVDLAKKQLQNKNLQYACHMPLGKEIFCEISHQKILLPRMEKRREIVEMILTKFWLNTK
jgi:hypothetical protein